MSTPESNTKFSLSESLAQLPTVHAKHCFLHRFVINFYKELNVDPQEFNELAFKIEKGLPIDAPIKKFSLSESLAQIPTPEAKHCFLHGFVIKFYKELNIDPQEFNSWAQRVEQEFPLEEKEEAEFEEFLRKNSIQAELVDHEETENTWRGVPVVPLEELLKNDK